ncbi:MAG: hypothetical protein OHK0053_37450 [Microscillaceae bacterium]
MKNAILYLFAGGLCLTQIAQAQTEQSREYRNFPIIITLQFHALSTPFRNLKADFKNIGIGIGKEVRYHKAAHWTQQFHLLWYRNKATGNGTMFYSQAAWRPDISANVYGEIKAGLGYLISKRPSPSFVQSQGRWVSVGRKGKGLLALPVGVSLGYQEYSEHTYLSPFISYQVMLLKGYNQTIPVIPESLFQIGTRIHP